MSAETQVIPEKSRTRSDREVRRGRGAEGGVGHRWVPYAFIAPNMVGLLVFTLIPVIFGVFIAFTKWNVVSGLQGIEWVGIANFVSLVQEPEFWAACLRTLVYAGVSVPLAMGIGLLLALALNRPLPGRGALRLIFFSPTVVTIIATGAMWLIILNPTSGMINVALKWLGIDNGPGWLVSPHWSLISLIIISVWGGAGYNAIIYLAALQDAPAELVEAAKIDGAGWFQRFKTVVWRFLMPTSLFLAVTGFLGQSQTFGLMAFLTSGGPGHSTTVLSYYMYKQGFLFYHFGYSAAVGVMSFLGISLLTLALWRLQQGRGLYT